MTDTKSVIAYLDHELGDQRTLRRIVEGFDEGVLDEVITFFEDQKINVEVEQRDQSRHSFWVTLTRK